MLRIRPFSPTDISAVSRVVKYSLGEKYPPSLYLTVYNLWPEGFLIAELDDEVLGFVAAVESGANSARVLMLAVMPQHRRKAVGRRLMDALYENCIARGYTTVHLEVRKSNRSAISFYERQGFSVFGEYDNFYSNGEGAYRMMKTLTS